MGGCLAVGVLAGDGFAEDGSVVVGSAAGGVAVDFVRGGSGDDFGGDSAEDGPVGDEDD